MQSGGVPTRTLKAMHPMRGYSGRQQVAALRHLHHRRSSVHCGDDVGQVIISTMSPLLFLASSVDTIAVRLCGLTAGPMAEWLNALSKPQAGH